LSLGVPQDWLPTLRKVVNDDQLLIVVAKLPEEVGERLLNLAAGEFVTPPQPLLADASPLEHPDVRRRFFVTDDADEMRHALEAPLHRWISFLHPSQRKLVEGAFKGPAKVTGSAGTGKTVVAMHRARHLARAGHEVLLTSYVRTLCKNVERSLGLFCSPEELRRITVSTVHGQALAIVRKAEPNAQPAKPEEVEALLDRFAHEHAPSFDRAFVGAEWSGVIEPQGIVSWPEYRKARRTGRGKALSVGDRKALWEVFGGVQAALAAKKIYDWPGMCRRAIELLEAGEVESPYAAVIVDEVQDLTPPALRFLATLAAAHPENLMLVGDAGQRIYPGRFGLSSLGVNVRGRSHVLRLNYRTTEQIRRSADKMLGQQTDDMDDGEEQRDKTRSLLSGPMPKLHGYENATAELEAGVTQVGAWLGGGLAPESIAVFARSRTIGKSIFDALREANIQCHHLVDDESASPSGAVCVGTMHRAKGLEFKAVLLFGCTSSQLPNAAMLRSIDDPQDRDDASERDRRLFYVAMTRARDELTISWSGAPSPFLDVLR
jgi:superfamily I DNA/RNA helicase